MKRNPLRWRTFLAGLALFLGSILVRGATTRPDYFRAADALELSPLMTSASHVGLSEAGALDDFILPMVTATAEPPAPDCWAEFLIGVPRPGSYWLWARVRFPAGAGEAFRVTGPGVRLESSLLIIAAETDSRDWHWTRCGPLRLLDEPSKLRIYLHRAAASTFGPLHWRQAELTQTPRLNVLCLTGDPAFTPTDPEAHNALDLNPIDLPAPHVKPARLSPLPANQAPVENRQHVPDWMRCPRWFTKDSWRDELRTRRAGDIAALVREVAANSGETLRLSCFWGGEAYFQSQVAPLAPGLGDLDYLQEAMVEGERTGVKIVAYLNPNALCVGHPLFNECVIRQADGQLSTQPAYGPSWRPQAAYACINHPRYRQFLRELLTEIFTRYRPAGLYVDGLTPHVCFCVHCRAKWRVLFGSEMPAASLSALSAPWAVWSEFGRDPQPVGDPLNDPAARQLTELLSRSLVEVTHEVSRTVKLARADAVTLFHSHPKPGTDADYDGTLTEVYSPRPWVHLAWRSGELAGYSAAYRVPVLFNIYPHRHFTAAEAQYHALQGLANGAYPNFWSAAGMKPVFEYASRCADYLDFATSAPVRFLALPRDLYESETQRRTPISAGVSYAGRDRFLAPYVGAYSALLRSGLPVVTLQRPHFEQDLAGFRVLVLANVALMSDEQAQAVRRFVQDGGGLLATHETSAFDEAGRRRTDFVLADVLGVHYQGTIPSALREAKWQSGHPLSLASLEISRLQHDEPVVKIRLDGAETAAMLAGDLPAVVTHRFGRGRVVYLPGRFDSMQCYTLSPAIERLFAAAVRWLAPAGLPVEIDAPGTVGVSLFRQPHRLVVHLVNHERDSQFRSDSFTSLRRVGLRIALPPEALLPKVRRLWQDREVPFRTQGQSLSAELDVLDEYEAVAVDW